jgi:hypothetical protein
MSEKEKLQDGGETGREQLPTHESEASRQNLERIQEEAKKPEHDHSIDKIQRSIHKEAISAKEITVGEHRQDSDQPVRGVQKELKADAYRRTIKKVQGRLGFTGRVLSKAIHSNLVEPVSEVSAKTIARPSGILGGGISALAGSGAALYMAKHYGFTYNFTTFLILLSAGFAVGVAVEALIGFIRRR